MFLTPQSPTSCSPESIISTFIHSLRDKNSTHIRSAFAIIQNDTIYLSLTLENTASHSSFSNFSHTIRVIANVNGM